MSRLQTIKAYFASTTFLLGSCQNVVPEGSDDADVMTSGPESTTNEPVGSSGSGSSDPSDPSDPGPVDPDDPIDPSTSTGSMDEDTDCGFDCGDPPPRLPIECSLWEQDCPKGEKCNPWADDGGPAWNATRCVRIVPEPDGVDELCTVEGGPTTGIDSCELGAMCWDVDAETNQGTCVPHCIGSIEAPNCADPGRECVIPSDGVLSLCLPSCDPLDPGTCAEQEVCIPSNGGFLCAPDGSGDGGGPFEDCEFVNGCDPGLICANPDVVGQCGPGAPACCTAFCDLDAPECPPMTACQPAFFDGEAPMGLEHVGFCGAPV